MATLDIVIGYVSHSFVLKSGGASNHMTSGLMTSVMEDGHLTELVDSARKINEVIIVGHMVYTHYCHVTSLLL